MIDQLIKKIIYRNFWSYPQAWSNGHGNIPALIYLTCILPVFCCNFCPLYIGIFEGSNLNSILFLFIFSLANYLLSWLWLLCILLTPMSQSLPLSISFSKASESSACSSTLLRSQVYSEELCLLTLRFDCFCG